MKIFIFILVSTYAMAASLDTDFYNEKKQNSLICKITTNSYKVVNKANSTIVVINGTTFFKMNDENTYINSSACHPVREGNTAIIF